MTLVVLGLDALDPDLVDRSEHPNLTLKAHRPIETIVSSSGDPSTHELWPTIITGLVPEEHGLVLDDGVAWGSPLLTLGSRLASYVLPNRLQTWLGAWLLTNTRADAFRTPATYYQAEGLDTVFDGRRSKAIGVPNYVVDPDDEDREHALRRELGELFERDSDARGGHTSADPDAFYELCLEMSMIRIARVRRALRSRQYELVFGYTSGLDLVGHVSYDRPDLQERSYQELNDFVGELAADLAITDELLLVSDHGLKEGVHTEEAMVASSREGIVRTIGSVVDVREAIEAELRRGDHAPAPAEQAAIPPDSERAASVREQLKDLGYM